MRQQACIHVHASTCQSCKLRGCNMHDAVLPNNIRLQAKRTTDMRVNLYVCELMLEM
jgi:hypothetical protein